MPKPSITTTRVKNRIGCFRGLFAASTFLWRCVPLLARSRWQWHPRLEHCRSTSSPASSIAASSGGRSTPLAQAGGDGGTHFAQHLRPGCRQFDLDDAAIALARRAAHPSHAAPACPTSWTYWQADTQPLGQFADRARPVGRGGQQRIMSGMPDLPDHGEQRPVDQRRRPSSCQWRLIGVVAHSGGLPKLLSVLSN